MGLWGKFVLLAAVAVLFSSVSTSFFLPFFGTLAAYLAGSASQQVYDYVTSSYGKLIAPSLVALIKGLYYLLPNFSAFDFKTQAIYGLPVDFVQAGVAGLYLVVYVGLCLWVAVWVFSRRQFP